MWWRYLCVDILHKLTDGSRFVPVYVNHTGTKITAFWDYRRVISLKSDVSDCILPLSSGRIWLCFPEDCYHCTRRRENLLCHLWAQFTERRTPILVPPWVRSVSVVTGLSGRVLLPSLAVTGPIFTIIAMSNDTIETGVSRNLQVKDLRECGYSLLQFRTASVLTPLHSGCSTAHSLHAWWSSLKKTIIIDYRAHRAEVSGLGQCGARHVVLEQRHDVVRFQVLTAASMKLRIFWDVLPCS
jgi:hypothetical protein